MASAAASGSLAHSPPRCSGRHKLRLFIGEGNFSFTEAFIDKHNTKFSHDSVLSLAYSIIATDVYLDGLPESKREEIEQRMTRLKAKGVRILALDGTKIHEKFQGAKFDRIHWNGPYACETSPAPLLYGFFQSCMQVQDTKGRVHVSIDQPEPVKGTPSYPFYQGFRNQIVKAASNAGYVILKKRKFDKTRYPEYQPVHFAKEREHTTRMREFVFEKIDPTIFENLKKNANLPGGTELEFFGDPKNNDCLTVPLARALLVHTEKACNLETSSSLSNAYLYYDCSTDDDSSDCEV